MMSWIVGSSLKARRAVVLAAVVLLAVGIATLRQADTDALPEFGPTTVQVQIEALGLSSEEVEQLITVPMEQDLLDGVAWLDTIESTSVPGLSSITMRFEPGTDLYRARQVVQERISQAAGLPQVSKPPQMLQPASATARTAMISLSSKTLTPLQIGVLARWTIRPRLMAVPGVSNVAIWGQRERQLQVQVDPIKLRDQGVSLEQVITSAGNALWVSPLTFLEASSPGTGGFIDTPAQRIGIQHNLPILAAGDLAEIPIDDVTGAPLTLGDVATIVEDHQPLIGDAVVTGEDAGQAGFMVVVDKLPGANTTDVTRGIEAALAELQPGLGDLTVDPTIFRPASYVEQSTDHLTRMVVVAGLALVLLLFALLLSWRTALVALAAVAVSFTIAGLVIHAVGATVNAVVFAGLVAALAVVVDDAIANVDRSARRLADRAEVTGDGTTSVDIVRSATLETGRTVTWATVVFGLALVPVLFMDRLAGDAFFPPMAVACLLAVVTSLVVAMTLTPALCVLVLGHGPLRRRSAIGDRLERAFDRAAGATVSSRLPSIVALGAAALTIAFVAPGFDKSLLPALKDTNVLVHWDAPFGTSLPEMDRITSRAAEELRALPGVKAVGAQVGQASLGDAPVGSDSAEMWVSLDPSAPYGRTLRSIEEVVAGYPGLHHEVTTYEKDKMTAILAPTRNEVTVRVFGTDLDVLHQKADEIKGAVARIDGVANVAVSAAPAEPTMEIEVDLEKAKAVGIKPGEVRRAAATLLSGLRVGNLFEDQKVFDVMVWSTPSSRSSVSSVADLLIDAPDGAHVRLGDIAAVRVRSTTPRIEHKDISRFVDVAVDVSGRSAESVAADVRTELAGIDFPVEYHAELVGAFAAQQHALRRLVAFVVAAAVGVFLLLQAAFGSWRLAIIGFLTLPVALTGGVLAARLDGNTATLATIGGLLAVLALSLRNTMMLLDRYRERRRSSQGAAERDVVLLGARDCVTPIVLSSALTAAALLPAVVFGEIAGLEIVEPMAIVVLGGLVSSTLATLFVLPSWYLRFAPRREPQPLDFSVEHPVLEPELATAGADAI